MSRSLMIWIPLGLLLLSGLFSACQHEELDSPEEGSVAPPLSDILFLDPEPDSSTTAPWWGPVNIDIDQDGITDMELRVLFALDSTIPWPEALWGTQVACVDPTFRLSAGTIDGGYSPILLGDPIGTSSTWWNAVTLHNDQPGGGSYGYWSYPSQGFIGVERTRGDSTNYGWVSIHTGYDNITYQSSAFQRIPGVVIHAGDTGE